MLIKLADGTWVDPEQVDRMEVVFQGSLVTIRIVLHRDGSAIQIRCKTAEDAGKMIDELGERINKACKEMWR